MQIIISRTVPLDDLLTVETLRASHGLRRKNAHQVRDPRCDIGCWRYVQDARQSRLHSEL